MKINPPPRVVRYRGLSLIELTIVIATLISLISILFVGARAWRRGSDRACCILTLRNMQVATRSYQNLYGYDYGGHPYADGGTQDIAEHLYKKGYIEAGIYKESRGLAHCPAGGTYSCPLPDIFPEMGKLYMECSLSVLENHFPTSSSDW